MIFDIQILQFNKLVSEKYTFHDTMYGERSQAKKVKAFKYLHDRMVGPNLDKEDKVPKFSLQKKVYLIKNRENSCIRY